MKKKIILITPVGWIIDLCHKNNIEFILIQKPNLYKYLNVNEAILIDYDNEELLFPYIDSICKNNKIIACLTGTESALTIAKKITDKYHLPYDTCADIELITNKVKMRSHLNNYKDFYVPFEMIETKEKLHDFIKNQPQTIVKPIAGAGSKNIYKINELNIKTVGKQLLYPVLAEQYIEGPEFSVEAFSFNKKHFIIGITEKFIDSGNFVEKRHIFPASLSKKNNLKIVNKIKSFLDAIGIINGPSHTEIKINNNKIYIIETHNRPGGDCISNLIKLSTGIDLANLLVAWPMNKVTLFKEKIEATSTSLIEFIFSKNGILRKTHGLDIARTVPGVIDISLYYSIGDYVPETKDSYTRLGHIIINRANRSECLKVISEVTKNLNIEIEPS